MMNHWLIVAQDIDLQDWARMGQSNTEIRARACGNIGAQQWYLWNMRRALATNTGADNNSVSQLHSPTTTECSRWSFIKILTYLQFYDLTFKVLTSWETVSQFLIQNLSSSRSELGLMCSQVDMVDHHPSLHNVWNLISSMTHQLLLKSCHYFVYKTMISSSSSSSLN